MDDVPEFQVGCYLHWLVKDAFVVLTFIVLMKLVNEEVDLRIELEVWDVQIVRA